MVRLFLCPNSRSRMPYLKGFESSIVKKGSILIVWDRFHSEVPEENVIIYRDKKVGMARGFLDYVKFSLFVFLKSPRKVDSVVFFGPQVFLFCFLRFFFVEKKYLDVRDWHPSINFIPMLVRRRLDKVFVSSVKFSSALGVDGDKVIISHNCWSFERSSIPLEKRSPIKVSYIGSIRDLKMNSALISALGNVSGVELWFHGDGDVVDDLKSQVSSHRIENVYFTGAYNPKDESRIYQYSTFIASLIPSSGINNKFLLTNRLYNAALNTRPLIVLKGTYLADVVDFFGIGLVLDNLDNLPEDILLYFSEFNYRSFESRCEDFINKVRGDMQDFYFYVDEI